MSDRPLQLTMRVIPEDGHWVALVEDVPDFRGGVTGDSIVELHEEAEAIKHFALNVPKETPVYQPIFSMPTGICARSGTR
jgi:hypothetical protein